jgi:hypothetical protein
MACGPGRRRDDTMPTSYSYMTSISNMKFIVLDDFFIGQVGVVPIMAQIMVP